MRSDNRRCYIGTVSDSPFDDEFDPLPALRGRAWVFGDSITADAVLPAIHLQRGASEVGAFAMAGVDPSFAGSVAAGDFIVAGVDFGTGTAQTLTAVAIQSAGIAAVIARSFGRLFTQAAANVGLPALIIEETGAIKPGDRLRVDLEVHKVVNLSSGDRYVIRNLTETALAILRAGGLTQYHRKQRQP